MSGLEIWATYWLNTSGLSLQFACIERKKASFVFSATRHDKLVNN